MIRPAERRILRGCACIFDRDAKLAWPCAGHSSFSLPRGWIGCPMLGCINRGNARLVAAHLVYTHSWPAAHVALFLWHIFRLENRMGIALPPFLDP
jgi:hypothetical protein